jgi:hypothetical protein
MRAIYPLLLAILFLAAAPVRPARADDEKDKAASGEKFLEVGGNGTAPGGTAVGAGEGNGGAKAMGQINAPEDSKGLKTGSVPAPGKGDALGKALGATKGAVYGTVAGGVIGAVAGAVGGPAGVLGGAVTGAKFGAMAGAALGALAGFLLAGKAGDGKPGVLEQRQRALDDAMKGN